MMTAREEKDQQKCDVIHVDIYKLHLFFHEGPHATGELGRLDVNQVHGGSFQLQLSTHSGFGASFIIGKWNTQRNLSKDEQRPNN